MLNYIAMANIKGGPFNAPLSTSFLKKENKADRRKRINVKRKFISDRIFFVVYDNFTISFSQLIFFNFPPFHTHMRTSYSFKITRRNYFAERRWWSLYYGDRQIKRFRNYALLLLIYLKSRRKKPIKMEGWRKSVKLKWSKCIWGTSGKKEARSEKRLRKAKVTSEWTNARDEEREREGRGWKSILRSRPDLDSRLRAAYVRA